MPEIDGKFLMIHATRRAFRLEVTVQVYGAKNMQ